MSRTVTALYDTQAEAEAARQRLKSAVDVERVKILDNDRSLNDYHMSSDDRQAYREGIRRGGALLCAEVDGHDDADKIVRALEETSSVDLDQRQDSWRQDGWAPTGGTGQQQQGLGSGMAAVSTGTGTAARAGIVEEEHIPIVEEELKIGKREVERGGARVRSYIREVPVHEQVTLREEHVQVERRPVAEGTTGAIGATSGATADLLQERTIEMVEKAEEAVVQKVAQVREEVVVSKTAEERTQQIDETVRHTEVEIDEGGARGTGSTEKSAFGGFGGGGSGSTGGGPR
jgi:uncharacterized protein (TIGR02271 family)